VSLFSRQGKEVQVNTPTCIPKDLLNDKIEYKNRIPGESFLKMEESNETKVTLSIGSNFLPLCICMYDFLEIHVIITSYFLGKCALGPDPELELNLGSGCGGNIGAPITCLVLTS
jgi:hypothetical protein